MNKAKRIICILLSLCLIIGFASCKNDNPDENITENPSSNQTQNENNDNDIKVLSLNKESISHHEWYEDFPTMLVKSEYSDVTLDKSMEEQYPELAEALSETSTMRKRAMEDEKDNLLADATREFMNDGEAFSTHISSLDVYVRRADSVAVSILEDYNSDGVRAISGLNYDTESGEKLALSDVVNDVPSISSLVEKEILNRIGEDESLGGTAVADYFNNRSEDDIRWTFEYNGITFWFNPGDIAPTNFGVQTVTLTFEKYPELFVEKYTAVPGAYTIGLPLSTYLYTDVTGDKQTEEIFVEAFSNDDIAYSSFALQTEESYYEDELVSYGLEPYYVKTADGNSYIFIFSKNSDDETSLKVFDLKDGKVKFVDEAGLGILCNQKGIYTLPTNPAELELFDYDNSSSNTYFVGENGISQIKK